jgi:hypothetical protein
MDAVAVSSNAAMGAAVAVAVLLADFPLSIVSARCEVEIKMMIDEIKETSLSTQRYGHRCNAIMSTPHRIISKFLELRWWNQHEVLTHCFIVDPFPPFVGSRSVGDQRGSEWNRSSSARTGVLIFPPPKRKPP